MEESARNMRTALAALDAEEVEDTHEAPISASLDKDAELCDHHN